MERLFNKFEKMNSNSIREKIVGYIEKNEKKVIVTANSEIIHQIYFSNDGKLKKNLLSKETLLVSDGNGLKLALKKLGYKVENYPGVEIVLDLLEYANENNKKVAVLGSSEASLNLFLSKIITDYPNIEISGAMHGYVSNDEKKQFLENQSIKKPDIVLVALGVPYQEKIIYTNMHKFSKGILIGCGGSLDVIGGYKKRAPKVFIKTKTEWLYRIALEPQRIPRFISSNHYLFKLVREYKVK